MSLWDFFKDKAVKDAEKRIYVEIPPDHVDKPLPATAIVAGQHYVRLWLSEMFLRHEVAWFKTWYPAVHSLVDFELGGQSVEIPNIADASKVGMSAASGDSSAVGDVIARNFQLTPAMPFNGGTISLDAGLLAIEGQNYLGEFLDTMSGFASLLNVPQISSVLNIATPLATGIQKLVGSGGSHRSLGIRDTFAAGTLSQGYRAAIRATEGEVDTARLWVRDGQLREGDSLANSVPFTRFDHLLFRFEVFDKRDDWERLPAIAEPQKQMIEALYDAEKEAQAVQFLRTAQLRARQAPELTVADRRNVFEALKQQFEEERAKLGISGLTDSASEPPTLAHALRFAMPSAQALDLGEPTLDEVFAEP